MAKTQEELNAIKEDVETLNNKPNELTEEELAQVSGGRHHINNPGDPDAPRTDAGDYVVEPSTLKQSDI